MGCIVPKLGVPGRPAGGVDSLAQIEGYSVNLKPMEVRRTIERCGYAHFLADTNHAPLDKQLFAFRQQVGAQNVPELAIASILAKKIAVGLQRAGLDIRVAEHGNLDRVGMKRRKMHYGFVLWRQLSALMHHAYLRMQARRIKIMLVGENRFLRYVNYFSETRTVSFMTTRSSVSLWPVLLPSS